MCYKYGTLFYCNARENAGVDTRKPPRTPRTRTPSRDVHSALVEAAEAVLVRDGAAAVTVRAVAMEAGVAPMGVYNRFGSKDGLIEALLIRGYAGLRDAVQVLDEHDPIERLHRSGQRYRAFALSHREHYGIMFEGVIPVAEYSPELGEVASAAFNALVAHVEYAMAAGVIARDDPREAAQMIWSAVHGAVSLELHDSSQAPDPAQNYERLLGLIIRGLQPGSLRHGATAAGQ